MSDGLDVRKKSLPKQIIFEQRKERQMVYKIFGEWDSNDGKYSPTHVFEWRHRLRLKSETKYSSVVKSPRFQTMPSSIPHLGVWERIHGNP